MLPVVNPAVVFRALSDGAVLFSSADEVYFGLNSVGARVWALLPPVSRTLDELCAVLAIEYPDVELATLRADVVELLDELRSHGLVLPAEAVAPQSAHGLALGQEGDRFESTRAV